MQGNAGHRGESSSVHTCYPYVNVVIASASCIPGAIVCGTGYAAIGRLRRPYKVSNEDECGDGREKEDAGDDRPHGLSLATCPTCAAHKTYNNDRDSARSTRDTGDKYTILLRLC
ncbi:hypothetical protein BD779DRAFT_1473702 [Infundibulicybe gibba]|nr:hypothetical protein BD779DRAFT_1473702 [Infundibulicybe gibba]